MVTSGQNIISTQKYPHIVRAKVKSRNPIITAGIAEFEIDIEDRFINPEELDVISKFRAKNSVPNYVPGFNHRVLVMFPNYGGDEAYIIGKIQDVIESDVKENEYTDIKGGSSKLTNDKGSGVIVNGEGDSVVINASQKSMITLDKTSFTYTGRKGFLTFEEDLFDVEINKQDSKEFVGKLSLNSKGFEVYSEGNIVLTSGGKWADSVQKKVAIRGGGFDVNVSSNIRLNSGTTELNTGDTIFKSTYYKHVIGSKLLTGDPTALFQPSFDINILSGDAVIQNATGSIKLHSVLPAGTTGPNEVVLQAGLPQVFTGTQVSVGAILGIDIEYRYGPKFTPLYRGINVGPTGITMLAGPLPPEPSVLGLKLLTLLTNLLIALQTHNHGTGVGPSSPPINLPQFTAVQAQLATILSPFVKNN